MLELSLLRELTLDAPSAPDRPAFISAASGLVQAGDYWYVVADDELHLGVFTRDHTAPGRLLRLFAGELPAAAGARKKVKPDLEALTVLPPASDFPHGILLALGSGSKPNRERGILYALDRDGGLDGAPRMFSLSALYGALRQRIGELNIEGIAVVGEKLKLLQRGNNADPRNFVITMALPEFVNGIDNSADKFPSLDMKPCVLDAIDGVPLSFTDAAALPDGRLLFTAVAEDTADSYRDGACVGAAIGILDSDDRVQKLERLRFPHKVEGVSVTAIDHGLQLLLVTDADNPAVAAQLLSTQWRMNF